MPSDGRVGEGQELAAVGGRHGRVEDAEVADVPLVDDDVGGVGQRRA